VKERLPDHKEERWGFLDEWLTIVCCCYIAVNLTAGGSSSFWIYAVQNRAELTTSFLIESPGDGE